MFCVLFYLSYCGFNSLLLVDALACVCLSAFELCLATCLWLLGLVIVFCGFVAFFVLLIDATCCLWL